MCQNGFKKGQVWPVLGHTQDTWQSTVTRSHKGTKKGLRRGHAFFLKSTGQCPVGTLWSCVPSRHQWHKTEIRLEQTRYLRGKPQTSANLTVQFEFLTSSSSLLTPHSSLLQWFSVVLCTFPEAFRALFTLIMRQRGLGYRTSTTT